MKIVVPMKRTIDPESADRVITASDHVDVSGLGWIVSPLDESAVETALRLTENGASPRTRLGETVAVTLGPKESELVLRKALALGVERAVRVDALDEALDGLLVAQVLRQFVLNEGADLVIMARQTLDSEGNHVAAMLAAMLDWPFISVPTSVRETNEGLVVEQEQSGCCSTFCVSLPAVLSVDVRILAPRGACSRETSESFEYYDGVRFASLKAVMLANRKAIFDQAIADYLDDGVLSAKYQRFERPAPRKQGVIVKDVGDLVRRLRSEANVV